MEQYTIEPKITLTTEGLLDLASCYRQAQQVGPNTALYIALLIKHGRMEKRMIDGCHATLRLVRAYRHSDIEAGCQRALMGSNYNYKTIKTIMENGAYRLDLPKESPEDDNNEQEHDNLRGRNCF